MAERLWKSERAASSTDKYLGGDGIITELSAPPAEGVEPLTHGLSVVSPVEHPELPTEEPLEGLAEVEATYSKAPAGEEATRCPMRDLPIVVDRTKCTVCMVCQMICSLKFTGNAFNLSQAALRLKRTDQGTCEIEFIEKCDNCGLCI